jgi:hypothetical protein
VNILDVPSNIDIALFEDMGNYDSEKGYFATNDYDNVGGVLIWDCKLTTTIEYRCKYFVNKKAKEPFSISTTKIL